MNIITIIYLSFGFFLATVSIPASITQMKKDGELTQSVKDKITKKQVVKLFLVMTFLWLPLFAWRIIDGVAEDVKKEINS